MFRAIKQGFAVCLLSTISLFTHAQTGQQVKVVVVPIGGEEPAKEKVIFITKGPINSTDLGGLSGADDLCQSEAEAPESKVKGKTFKAWLAPTPDHLETGEQPFMTFELPYVTPTGVPYVASYSDMISGDSFPFLSEGADGTTLPKTSSYDMLLTGRSITHAELTNCNAWQDETSIFTASIARQPLSDATEYVHEIYDCQTLRDFCVSPFNFPCRIICMEQ